MLNKNSNNCRNLGREDLDVQKLFPINLISISHYSRVDRLHPMISAASMFGPSPDWVVGVSKLNLCRKDCTWTKSEIIDLYPWDAGTDNGISYMSPNSETKPREKMKPITTLYPEDPRSPFYDPTGRPMQPLARLYLNREKIIPRGCDEEILQQQVTQLEVAENTEDTSRRRRHSMSSYLILV